MNESQSWGDWILDALWSQFEIGDSRLNMLDAASTLDALRVPPGNRLEALLGKRKGFHSVRINSQYRVVFRWVEGGAEEVEIVDYH